MTTTAPHTRVTTRRGDETKAFFKTTEFVVFIVATVGVLLASYLVQATDGRDDYFLADKAWLYVVILSVGYMVSRGPGQVGQPPPRRRLISAESTLLTQVRWSGPLYLLWRGPDSRRLEEQGRPAAGLRE